MKPFVSGDHKIDLLKTLIRLDAAYNFIKDTVANGGKILFVGTQPILKDWIKEEAIRTNSLYINQR
jgi:small subunit ribosomal protein S2